MHPTCKLIAFDMDGTLLDDQKQILPSSVRAIHQAAEAGKIVCLATGRALTEIQLYREALRDVRYAVLISGSFIYDLKEEKVLSRTVFSREETKRILDAVGDRDIMVQPMSGGRAYMTRENLRDLARYHMDQYRALYESAALFSADTREMIRSGEYTFEKINLNHPDTASRALTRARLSDTELEMADAEVANLEINPPGVSKGRGIRILGGQIGVDPAEMMAVGDAENDRIMLETVGFPVVMGNASPEIKKIARAVVADNNRGGCAEAIRKYLLA